MSLRRVLLRLLENRRRSEGALLGDRPLKDEGGVPSGLGFCELGMVPETLKLAAESGVAAELWDGDRKPKKLLREEGSRGREFED